MLQSFQTAPACTCQSTETNISKVTRCHGEISHVLTNLMYGGHHFCRGKKQRPTLAAVYIAVLVHRSGYATILEPDHDGNIVQIPSQAQSFTEP